MIMDMLNRFDRLVVAIVILLVTAIGGVIWSGDQVGIYVIENGPTGSASGSDPIRLRFSEGVSPGSVEERFQIEPDVQGEFSWAGRDTLIFTPDRPWIAGQVYTVTVEDGVRAAQQGRELLNDQLWTFTVRLPRVIYLAPADALDTNLYMSDLETGEIYQLTDTDQGIEDFAVSPDGRQIAYSQNTGTTDIWVLDMSTQSRRQVTNCVDALCYDPSWNAARNLLAYQREELNTGLNNPSRVWVVDLKTLDTRLLFDDPQILGSTPAWSPDGQLIAVFDGSIPGIRIVEYETQTDEIIDSMQGLVGSWSPDSRELAYPVLTRGLLGEQFYTYLEAVNLDDQTRRRISGPEDEPVEDKEGIWIDDQTMIIARRYLDGRFTRGAQIYRLNVTTGQAEPLVIDAEYHHAVLSADPAGQRLVFQRLSLTQPDARPEIWIYDLVTQELKLVATNAYLPGWLP